MRTRFNGRRPKGRLNRRDMDVLRAGAQDMGVSQTAQYLGVSKMWVRKVRRRIRFELGFTRGVDFKTIIDYAQRAGII